MAEQRVQRRLAAILAADVVGYSRLMGENEVGTRRRFNAHLHELIEPAVANRQGRVVKTTGDALLVEFASVVDAVQCAVEIQKGMVERNTDEPDNQRIKFRIGVNLGDVIIEGDDIHGDGVNVAARLEGLAEPGGICVSGKVVEEVRNKFEVGFEDMGAQVVKNIDRPLRCYRVHLESDGTTEVLSPPLPDKPSIAVLPFENMSGDPEQEYFSDGITEDIITELSKISGLFVIARHSSFTYKGKSVTLKQVGRELGVRYALEGSVRKAGNRLRITAQLIDTATDHHLWAERYDRDLENIFAVQDDVTREISAALKVALGPDESERLGKQPTDNPEAYDLFIKARAGFIPPTVENILWARNIFQQVVDLDPGFAGGYAGLSFTYSRPILLYHYAKTDEDVQQARQYADKALRLDARLAASHMADSLVAMITGEYDKAIVAARKAVELQPGNADTHLGLARVLYIAGRPEESFEPFKTAIRLDPQAWPIYSPLGQAYCVAGQFENAIKAFRHWFDRGGLFVPLVLVAWVAAATELGYQDEAEARAKDLLTVNPDFTVSGCRFLERFAVTGMKDRMATALIRAGLPE